MKLPRRALVLGLARSGQAAALALAQPGRAQRIGVDRAAESGHREACRSRRRNPPRDEEEGPAGRVELLHQEPGRARGIAAARRAARTRGDSHLERGRARLSPALANPIRRGSRGRTGRRRASELLGAMFRAAERPVAVAGNVGRPLTSLDSALEKEAWIVCELLELSARGRAPASASRRGAPEPRARPSRPPRFL